MRRWFRQLCINIARRLSLKIDNRKELESENRVLRALADRMVAHNMREFQEREYMERVSELIEARRMAGAGPWRCSQAVLDETDRFIALASDRIQRGVPAPGNGIAVRETGPIVAQGATGDIELALQNIEWRREINLSWLEFSRWGIQQIILISRLYYVKNPMVQRGVNVTANYVFGRGVEVIAEDDDANEELKDFFERNKAIVGQAALADLHKRLQYDGQIFYCFFADTLNSGKTSIRTIDAAEIFEIITDPDDSDQHWYYHRKWTARPFNPVTGTVGQTADQEAYYPALAFLRAQPNKVVDRINNVPVMKDNPVLMQKGGAGVGKWLFDVPKPYAALEWAKNGTRLLQADLSTRLALSQIAMTLTTKGGQQALEGAKQALGTTVGPTTNLWDMNPPVVPGGIFASGPGTTLAAFDTRGAIRNPSDVAEYRNMVGIVFEIPPTFLGDMDTSNLATATTLDRPTELAMIEKQERWREILITIATVVLENSQTATGGKLRESRRAKAKIIECPRVKTPNGQWVYEAAQGQPDDQIQLKCTFPAIREGDMPALVAAIVNAMTLENKSGQVVGIDEREGVKLLYEQLGVTDAGDILDKQYPLTGKNKYDPNRTEVDVPPPIPKPQPIPGGAPQAPGGNVPAPGQNIPAPSAAPGAAPTSQQTKERFLRVVNKLKARKRNASTQSGNGND